MPIVDLEPVPLATPPVNDAARPALDMSPSTPVMDFGFHSRDEKPIRPDGDPSVWGAAFRQNNIVASVMSRQDTGIDNTRDENEPDYTAWKDIAGTRYEPYWKRFADSNNRRYTDGLKRQIDMELDDRRTLDAAGIPGMFASMAAGTADFTTLLPGAGFVKAVKGGYLVSRSALMVGASAGAGALAQEAGLQATQQIRPLEESAIAVGGSVILGALIGSAGAALLNRSERKVVESAARVLYGDDAAMAARASATAGGSGMAGSVGAEAVEKPSREALAVEGVGAQAVVDTLGGISPNTRAMRSPAASVRRIMDELSENTVYRNQHSVGETSGPAVETLTRVNYNSRIRTAVSDNDEIFKAGRKAGMPLSRDEFGVAVGRALRRGDAGDNEFVTKAAQAWRRNVFDPFKDEAIDAGLLPIDVTPEGAASYFSRVYDRPRLIAGEADFKNRVTSYYGEKLRFEYDKHAASVRARIEELENEIADLRMAPEQRVKTLGDIQAGLRDLEAKNIDKIELAERITALNKTARDATEKGDRATAKTAREEAARLKKEGGKDFAEFVKERGRMRARARRVDMNYAGLEARQNRVMQQLADLEESNLRNMNRLVARGRKLEREASRLDPVAKEEKMAEFRTAFNQVLARSEKAQQRIADARAKIAENAQKVKADGGKAVPDGGSVQQPAGAVPAKAPADQGGVRADTAVGTAVPQARAIDAGAAPEVELPGTFTKASDLALVSRLDGAPEDVPSAPYKAPSDVLSRDAEQFAQRAVADPAIIQDFGALDVERRGVVLPVMRSLLQDDEIAKAVVRLLPVDVMNMLGGAELAPKALLDKPSMLVDLLPVNANDAVPSRVKAADVLAPYVALATAERPLIRPEVATPLREALSARAASKGDLHVSGKVPYPNVAANTGTVAAARLPQLPAAAKVIADDGTVIPARDYVARQADAQFVEAIRAKPVTPELKADLTPPADAKSPAEQIVRAAMGEKADTVADLETAITKAANASAPEGMRVKQSSLDEITAAVRETVGAADEGAQAAKSADDMDAMLAREAQREANRVEKLNSLARRMEALDAFNPEERLIELKRITDEIAAEVSSSSLAKGEKAAMLKGRYEQFSPDRIAAREAEIARMRADAERMFFDRWEVKRGGEGVDLFDPKNVNFDDFARQIADEVYDKIMGKDSAGVAASEFLTALKSGPLKERTFNVPDELIEDFLESNVEVVGRRYARSMSGQIEMTRRFGRADMDDQLKEIADEFRGLREAVQKARSPEEAYQVVGRDPSRLDGLRAWMRGMDAEAITKERLLNYLTDAEKEAKEDIGAVRDMILGRYLLAENAGDYARWARNAMAFNYIRVMGGSGIVNAISEVYRPAMVHGLRRFMGDGIAPLLKNMDAVKMSVREAQLAGQVVDVVTHNTLMSRAELFDPYAGNSAMERLLQNGTTIASKWNGLVYWTDAIKSVSSVMSQNRIIDGVMGQADDTRFLAYLGVGKKNGMADRIAEQFKTHGKTIDGVKVANTEAWTDKEAIRAFRAAVSKDVDSIIVTRSVGDVPLFANTPTGRLILQFRTFNIAAMQRVMLRGMQEEKAQFISAVIAMSSLGMMASVFRSWRGGEERWEKFKKSAENPGFLIGEGLDNSGIFTVPFEIANTAEKFAKGAGYDFNPIKKPLLMAFPGQTQQGDSTRFASRNFIGSLLGPTAGLLETGAKAAGGNTKAMWEMAPFYSYPGMRELTQILTDDSPYLKR